MLNLEEHINAFNSYLEDIRQGLKSALSARNVEFEQDDDGNDKDKISDLLKCILSFDPVPVGTVIASFAIEQPTGYLKCDGNKLLAKNYPNLYRCLKGSNAPINEDTKFELPDLRGKFIQGCFGTNGVGTTVDPALPNIKGDLVSVNAIGDLSKTGAFNSSQHGYQAKSHYAYSWTPSLSFDASRSNRIYQNDCNTVQPPAVLLNYYIKY
jgi:hypothetical protein